MKSNIRILGVHERDFLIKPLCESLNIDIKEHVFYDDERLNNNPIYNLIKAMEAPEEKEITHKIILQDDVIVCADFISITNKIIQRHPDSLIQLFPYTIESFPFLLDNKETPYLELIGILHCPGIILSVENCKKFVKWFKTFYNKNIVINSDEYLLMKWCKITKTKIISPNVFLIQHIGDDYKTTLNYTPKENRKSKTFKYNVDNDINWDSKKTLIFNYNYVKPT